MTADRDQFQAEIKRHKQRVRNLKRNIPEDAAAKSRKPKRFKAEASGSHKTRVQRLNRKEGHLERVLKGMESVAVVKESIDEYQSLPGEAKRENAELPAIAEYFLGHLRTMPYGPSVAAEVLDMTSNEGLLRYIRTNDRLMQTLIQEVTDKIEEQWSLERCHAIKVLLGLSDHKYGMLRKLLSSEHDGVQKWNTTLLWEEGERQVDMPKVKPLHVIKAKREEIAASIGLSENDDGSLAEVDLHSKIAAVIKQMRDSQTGMLHTRTARTTDELELRTTMFRAVYIGCYDKWMRLLCTPYTHTLTPTRKPKLSQHS
ncbi:hypothetical protein CYMTET_37114 [Cymbomonas tetramitiformis]|uniref:Uncharacterized protein n=1 Tax=Cymbomonas tetramitiformis TaxID=36881 RepID=A0AAE0F6A9_9CHLO|nr:hypothetical protein CYMTET_37114 [Cymbomonas tetramitiformis]